MVNETENKPSSQIRIPQILTRKQRKRCQKYFLTDSHEIDFIDFLLFTGRI